MPGYTAIVYFSTAITPVLGVTTISRTHAQTSEREIGVARGVKTVAQGYVPVLAVWSFRCNAIACKDLWLFRRSRVCGNSDHRRLSQLRGWPANKKWRHRKTRLSAVLMCSLTIST